MTLCSQWGHEYQLREVLLDVGSATGSTLRVFAWVCRRCGEPGYSVPETAA